MIYLQVKELKDFTPDRENLNFHRSKYQRQTRSYRGHREKPSKKKESYLIMRLLLTVEDKLNIK